MKTKVEATKQNIDASIQSIKSFAEEKGYRIIGTIESKEPSFSSNKQKKVCRNYLSRMQKKMTMSTANRFLHFLHKKVNGSTAPYLEYSEKECKIRELRSSWKKQKEIAEDLLRQYKDAKKGFFA